MRTIFALAAALGLTAGAAAQEPADSAPAPADSIAAPRRLAITGFAEGSYAYTTRGDGDAIVGRLFDRFHDEFALNALALTFELPYDPGSLSAGFHAELFLGQNAAVIKSGGFSLGDQGDIPHLYVTLNVPSGNGNGVQFKLGRIPTLLGLEVIEDINNPNWSEGNQFIYAENFTGTGLSVERKFSDRADAQLRIINGWDQVKDNNTRKSFMGRVGWYPSEGTTLAVVGFFGPEQTDDATADRYGAELLAGTRLGDKTTVWVQGDYGREQANAALPDPTSDAQWWAAGLWLIRDLMPKVALALRGDYVDDRDGARTSGVLGFPANTGQQFGSATATLNVRSWEGLLLRPEVRYDSSNLTAFDGEQDQMSFALSAAYIF
jgi:hypothetical protein